MSCEDFRKQLPLLLYGELSFEEEERLEQHLQGCAACAAERQREVRLQSLFDDAEAELPAGLLSQCRRDLSVKIASPGPYMVQESLWQRLTRAILHPPMWARPIGALALVSVGFFGARWEPATRMVARVSGQESSAPPVVARVRYLTPDPSGRVRVAYDEMRQREMSGDMEDSSIRQLLLAAVSDQADAGLRIESIDLLKSHCADEKVRRALLNALNHDPNAGVRLKALEALRPYAREAETRGVLARVLLEDDNPGVRMQAIDLLVQNKVPEVAGVLQELLRNEQNSYIRSRSQNALNEMKASVGTF